MTTRQFQALELSIDQLVLSPVNVRREVGDISELADSIRGQGILEPLIVRPTLDNKYEVIIGSRRLAAAKQLGLSVVPVVVQDISDAEAIIRSLVENLQRGDLSLEERVEAYKRLQALEPARYGSPHGLAQVTGLRPQRIEQDRQAFEALTRLRPHGVEVATQLQPSAPERRAREAIPERHATMLEQAMSAVQGKLPEEQVETTYVELARTIAPLEQDSARRVLDYFKMYPERPVSEIEAMALAMVERAITLPASTARRLEEMAARGGRKGWEEVITNLIETAEPATPATAPTTEAPAQEQLPFAISEGPTIQAPRPIRYEPVELPEEPLSVQLMNKVLWNLAHFNVKADFYTVGYAGREIDQLIEILKAAGVSTVVDIRDTPVSPYKPDFSKENLSRTLEEAGLRYIHRADLGVPRDVRVAAAEQRSREAIWRWYDQNVAIEGANGNLSDVVRSIEQPVVLMCVEVDPTACHRHRLFVALESAGLHGYDL